MEFLRAITTPVYFVFGGILLFLAYTIIRDNPSVRANRITGAMLFFAGLGPIFLALGVIVKPNVAAEAPFEESFVYNLFYIWELFFPTLLLFSWVFPIDRLSYMKRRRLRYLIFFPQVFHILLVLLFRNPERILDLFEVESGEGFLSLILEPISYLMKWVVLGFSLLLSSEAALFSFINLIYVGLAVYFLIRGKALIENKQVRRQTNVLIWGISVSVILLTAAVLIPKLFSIQVSDAFMDISMILVLLTGGGSIAWSIVRHQFLDVSIIFRQSLAYTVTSGILVGVYILLVGQMDRFVTYLFGAETKIVNIAFIVLALILYQPIINRIDDLIKKLFMKTRADYRTVLGHLSRSMISVFDPARVRSIIEKTLQTTILIEHVYFVMYDDVLMEYVLLASEGFPTRSIINREDPLLGAIGQLEAPQPLDRMGGYGKDSNLFLQLSKRRVQLILPLKDSDHLLGFLALTEKVSGYRYNTEDLTVLGVISNQLVTSLTNARLYADSLEKQVLEEEITMARQIQVELLPKKPPASNTFDLKALSIPSQTIGGDFYDFINHGDGKFSIVIADASGKGVPAALLVAQIQAMLHSEIQNKNELARILQNINEYVVASTTAEKYATLFYGEFIPDGRVFRYANAGHNYPMLVRADGSHEMLSKGGMLIGAFSGASYETSEVSLNDDDLMVFYTDGLSEAQNEKDEEYGEKRILDFVRDHRHLSPDDIIDGILKDVGRFDVSDPPRDDTTIIILKANNGIVNATG